MRPTRRIRLGRMEIENLGELQSCDQLDREKKQLEADDWYIRQLPTVLVAWRINDMQILLESGFRYTLHERLDGDLAAREAYRAALPQATSDLKKLISRLGSFWEESVPDMAVAIRRFETFLSGWRTYMRESWPDGWESLLAECHRLAAMRRTEIEEQRSRATLMQTWVSLIVALSAFLVSVIPLGWPNWMRFTTVGAVIMLVVLISIEQWRVLSGRRLIADNLGQCFHRFTGYVRRTYRKKHRQR